MTNALLFFAESSSWTFNSVTYAWIRDASQGFYGEANSLAFARDGDAPRSELWTREIECSELNARD
jgi:hypothetical protein